MWQEGLLSAIFLPAAVISTAESAGNCEEGDDHLQPICEAKREIASGIADFS